MSEKSPTQTKKLLHSSSSRQSVSRLLVYKWHRRFSDGRAQTRDNEWVDRPLSTDEKALTLVKERIDVEQSLTVCEIPEMCDLSKSTVYRIITENFGLCALGTWSSD